MKAITVLILYWLSAPVLAQSTARGLRGTYYQGPHFDKKGTVRIDKQINFHWDQQHKPSPGIDPAYFSVRWTGQLYAPSTGIYYFSSTAGDRIRFWIDGIKILANWSDAGLNQNPIAAYVKDERGSIYLQSGQWYDIKIDYSNSWGKSDMMLYWELPGDTQSELGLQGAFRKVIPAQNFSPVSKPFRTTSTTLKQAKPASPKTSFVNKATGQPRLHNRIDSGEKPTISESLPDVRLDKGKSVVLHQIQFAQSSHVLLAESFPVLDLLAILLTEKPSQRIEISGHTDNVGDAWLNITLSEYRARQVANYLVKRGISMNRIETKGYGSQRPITNNRTDLERAQNRRVEILVL